MVILRFKIRSKPDKSDELMAALAEIITPARATDGVINFDIARVLRDPDWFIATAVYEDAEYDTVAILTPDPPLAERWYRRHTSLVRITHWINVVCV